jgi:multicomponent K+:H+ antiporter subunit E
MRRWLPHPFLAVVLFLAWLLLNRSLEAGELVLGAVIALGAARSYAWLEPPAGQMRTRPPLSRRIATGAALLVDFAADVVRSNLAVARLVLAGGQPSHRSGFITVPLEVRRPGALATLACIVTATPGTSWAGYDAASHTLRIHMLELGDTDAWIAEFKARYERRVQELFE